MNTISATLPETAAVERHKGSYLFSPLVDFLGLGGASLIAMILLLPFAGYELDPKIAFIASVLVVASFINHPHFAHSYQIFYRDFRRKIGAQTPGYLRYRYWFAGIGVPILLALFFVISAVTGRYDLIGYGANAMAFLVGWHYVKQGYGMLSVDAVLKKKFFSDPEKKLLIWNGYAGWLYSWTRGNIEIREREMFELSFYTFNMPDWFYLLTQIGIFTMGALTLVMFARRLLPGGKGLALTGVMAYLTSIYVWLLAFSVNPLFAIFIPAFHSLQYLTVVGRFQLNVEGAKPEGDRPRFLSRFIKTPAKARLAKFYIFGLTVGFLGFLAIPFAIMALTDLSNGSAVKALPFVVFWLFINIHHYFLDNVMWRKGNPDVGKHLFAQR